MTNKRSWYGWLELILGVLLVVLGIYTFRNPTAAAGGIVSILIGILLLLNISVGVFAFSFLFPIWFMIHCITRLTNLGFVRCFAGNASYWISLTINVIGLIAGFVLLLNPFASTLSMTFCAGLYLLLYGNGKAGSASIIQRKE